METEDVSISLSIVSARMSDVSLINLTFHTDLFVYKEDWLVVESIKK